jgi:hypothetical protein
MECTLIGLLSWKVPHSSHTKLARLAPLLTDTHTLSGEAARQSDPTHQQSIRRRLGQNIHHNVDQEGYAKGGPG